VLVHQPAVDPRDRVPLLAWGVQVRLQDLVDEMPALLLACLRLCRLSCLLAGGLGFVDYSPP
jgi:hypothetical protein